MQKFTFLPPEPSQGRNHFGTKINFHISYWRNPSSALPLTCPGRNHFRTSPPLKKNQLSQTTQQNSSFRDTPSQEIIHRASLILLLFFLNIYLHRRIWLNFVPEHLYLCCSNWVTNSVWNIFCASLLSLSLLFQKLSSIGSYVARSKFMSSITNTRWTN